MEAAAHTTPARSRWVHGYAVTLACLVVGLIAAGALVKSKEAGLSVPDWPLSYGSLNPPGWWQIDNVRAEHGHRLYAGTVALLTLGLVWLVRRFEVRRWVRRLAYLAMIAVVLQALLGGLTVLLFLPPVVSVAHAALAQLFLCLVVAVAVVTSPGWQRTGAWPSSHDTLSRLATATTGAVFVQMLLGAVVRHSGAGLAIPDFPLAFGRLVPPRFDAAIAVHYIHRVGALVVASLLLAVLVVVVRRRPGRSLLVPALVLALLVGVQIALGGLVVLGGRQVLPNTLHVATGAAILAASLAITLNARRPASDRSRQALEPRLATGSAVS